MVNSRYRLFIATPRSSRRYALHPRWHTLSRSYGVNLPSSLTWILSSALVFSTRPPESVCGTVGSLSTQDAAFLGSLGSTASVRRPRHHLSGLPTRFVPTRTPYGLAPACTRVLQRPADLPSSVPALLQTAGAGILTRFPSTTPFGFALGADLPCPDCPWTGNLGLPATRVFTLFIATHVSIRTSYRSTANRQAASPLQERSPTTPESPWLR